MIFRAETSELTNPQFLKCKKKTLRTALLFLQFTSVLREPRSPVSHNREIILTVVSHLILVKELENATSVLVEVLGSRKITTFSDTKINHTSVSPTISRTSNQYWYMKK